VLGENCGFASIGSGDCAHAAAAAGARGWRLDGVPVFMRVGGKVVYASKEFSKLAPLPLPVSPDWSPLEAEVQQWSQRRIEASRTVKTAERGQLWGHHAIFELKNIRTRRYL